MLGVEPYAAVRLAVVDEGPCHHESGRRFGIDRRTKKKVLSLSCRRANASRAEGASPRARVPPVDYAHKLKPRSPW